MKFAVDVSSSIPMLLGPGMHYFNNVNINIDPDEIFLDSKGENKAIYKKMNLSIDLTMHISAGHPSGERRGVQLRLC